jgi:hypothetical protein
MALFEVAGGRLEPRAPIGFADLGLRERQDLQAFLFGQITALGGELKVIAQEYGHWEDSLRRLDILAVDSDRHLVVIELKRTGDGGHAELQALRYAAMIATLTFEEVLAAYEATLRTMPDSASSKGAPTPRDELLGFLGFEADEEPVLSSQVRIILVAADFGRELTTTVLWLNEFDGMDIRCVRMRPYQLGEKVLLDIEQLIPLPEAADYQVRVRRKVAEQERASTDPRDFTRYIVSVDGQDLGDFNKRNTARVVVEQLIMRGAPVEDVVAALPAWSLKPVAGEPQSTEAMAAALSHAGVHDPRRYFLDSPIHGVNQTWALSKMWAASTEDVLRAVLADFPHSGVDFRVSR